MKSERLPDSPAIAIDHLGAGELVVLMHGIGGNRKNWRPQLEALAPAFHGVAWDARGYGDSDDYEGPLHFEDFCHDLARLLDYFDQGKAHICGLSMGGQIAQHFYRLYPDRVRSLILAATFTHWRGVLSEAALEQYLALRREPLQDGGKSPADIAPAAAQAILGPNASVAQRAEIEQSIASLHKQSYLKTLDSATQFSKQLTLEDVNVPTLLIFSEFDKLCPAKYGRTMAARIPHAVFEYIEDAGHLINIEQPEAFSQALIKFLRRVSSVNS